MSEISDIISGGRMEARVRTDDSLRTADPKAQLYANELEARIKAALSELLPDVRPLSDMGGIGKSVRAFQLVDSSGFIVQVRIVVKWQDGIGYAQGEPKPEISVTAFFNGRERKIAVRYESTLGHFELDVEDLRQSVRDAAKALARA
jgi:hypothetical protein